MTCPLPRGVGIEPRVPPTSAPGAELASELGIDLGLAQRVAAQENFSFTGSAFYMPPAPAADSTRSSSASPSSSPARTPRPLRVSAAFIARAGGQHLRHALLLAGYTDDAGTLVSPVDLPSSVPVPATRGPVHGSRRRSRRHRRSSVRSNPSVRVGLDASLARAPASAPSSRCHSPRSPDSSFSRIDSAPVSVRNSAAPAPPATLLNLQRLQDEASVVTLQLRLDRCCSRRRWRGSAQPWAMITPMR